MKKIIFPILALLIIVGSSFSREKVSIKEEEKVGIIANNEKTDDIGTGKVIRIRYCTLKQGITPQEYAVHPMLFINYGLESLK